MGSIGVSGKASESSLTSGMVAWSWFGKGNGEQRIQTQVLNMSEQGFKCRRILGQLSSAELRIPHLALSDPVLRSRIQPQAVCMECRGLCLLSGANFHSNTKAHHHKFQAGIEPLPSCLHLPHKCSHYRYVHLVVCGARDGTLTAG